MPEVEFIESEVSKLPPKTEERMQVISLEKARFEKALSDFIVKPIDSELEMRFVSELYTMLFYVPVQVGEQTITARNRKPGLRLDVATMTYLADGNEYVPVFSSPDRMDVFLREMDRNIELRPMVLSAKELMFQARRVNVAGILVNPGEHNFPLSNEYWSYVKQIRPIELGDGRNFKLKIMSRDPAARIENKLKSVLKRMRTVKKAWLLGVKLPEHDEYEYVIIVEYIGEKQKFEEQVARKLAVSVRGQLPYRSDVLIGTTEDLVGRSASKNFTPFYERRIGLFG